MSYPRYKPDFSDDENNDPFIIPRAASSSSTTPTSPQRSKHFQNIEHPSKRSKVDKELSIKVGASPTKNNDNNSPFDSRFNFTSPFIATTQQASQAKKNKNETKIKVIETDKADLELKIEGLNVKIKTDSHTEIRKLQNEINMLTQNQLSTKNESRTKESDLVNQVRILEAEKTDLQSQIGYLDDQITSYSNRILSKQKLLSSTREQLTETEKKLRFYNTLSPQLDNQLDHIQKLEEKNRELDNKVKHYKEASPGIDILQQRLDETEHQISQLSVLRRKAAVLEVENTSLKNEKTEWSNHLDQEKDKLNINSPYNLCKELASRRTEIQILKTQIQNFDEQLKKKDIEISEKEIRINQTQEKCDLMGSKHAKEMESLKQDNLLLRKEVEMLSASLKSYEDEEKLLQIHRSA
ncbi:13995_t:CDS:10 [Entrophospora sp. SA101]|nr:127_t:CDS:10 [Entrophospora sp. SA101]CAJ0879663.1 13995_t:CDS:10 [Entrophospora sp. SA101]